jgi:hypothetical protein
MNFTPILFFVENRSSTSGFLLPVFAEVTFIFSCIISHRSPLFSNKISGNTLSLTSNSIPYLASISMMTFFASSSEIKTGGAITSHPTAPRPSPWSKTGATLYLFTASSIKRPESRPLSPLRSICSASRVFCPVALVCAAPLSASVRIAIKAARLDTEGYLVFSLILKSFS